MLQKSACPPLTGESLSVGHSTNTGHAYPELTPDLVRQEMAGLGVAADSEGIRQEWKPVEIDLAPVRQQRAVEDVVNTGRSSLNRHGGVYRQCMSCVMLPKSVLVACQYNR